MKKFARKNQWIITALAVLIAVAGDIPGGEYKRIEYRTDLFEWKTDSRGIFLFKNDV